MDLEQDRAHPSKKNRPLASNSMKHSGGMFNSEERITNIQMKLLGIV